ncbi:MaoC/PaaZ C-terminal domain-containing protein [Gordonia sp. VNK21]|uniref:MaoC/PaaZ C-terminal domain-containing protein n=1 Tax=Gordonia sp. VNK21 TaxID=3382483 RepID=UPI0038D3C88F
MATIYGEDLVEGAEYRLGEYTLTEAEIIDFAKQWDPQAFHTDPQAAESGAYRGIIASGVQTIAVMQRLTVQAVYEGWSVIAGRRVGETLFLRPVRPGDTLTGTAVLRRVVPEALGRTGVDIDIELTCDGKPVLTASFDVLVRTRAAG